MNYNKWKSLADEGYSSDVISFLQFIKEEEEVDEEHPKTQAIISLLDRKQLIQDRILTTLGHELLDNSEISDSLPIKRVSDRFEEWWKSYPASDAFNLDGRTFMGTQSKRIKKDLCKAKFNKLISSGIAAEDIIQATKYHVEQAKKLSLKKSQNQVSFIPNSERYIREEMFMPYIDLLKEKQEEIEFKSNIL